MTRLIRDERSRDAASRRGPGQKTSGRFTGHGSRTFDGDYTSTATLQLRRERRRSRRPTTSAPERTRTRLHGIHRVAPPYRKASRWRHSPSSSSRSRWRGKLAFPFVTLIMTLLAVPFASTIGRSGAMGGIGVGIGLAISYWT